MPYVHIDTDVFISPEECGTALSKGDVDTMLRFTKAARVAVDLLFDCGHLEQARDLMEAGRSIPGLFDLGAKLWPPLAADEAYRKWMASRP